MGEICQKDRVRTLTQCPLIHQSSLELYTFGFSFDQVYLDAALAIARSYLFAGNSEKWATFRSDEVQSPSVRVDTAAVQSALLAPTFKSKS